MSLVTFGFVGGFVAMLTGLMWLAVKIIKDDRKKTAVPLACFCWGATVLITCFMLRVRRAQGFAPQEIDLLPIVDPVLIGAGIFIFSIPIYMWFQEHGWDDRTIQKILYAVIIIAVAVPWGLHQLMK